MEGKYKKPQSTEASSANPTAPTSESQPAIINTTQGATNLVHEPPVAMTIRHSSSSPKVQVPLTYPTLPSFSETSSLTVERCAAHRNPLPCNECLLLVTRPTGCSYKTLVPRMHTATIRPRTHQRQPVNEEEPLYHNMEPDPAPTPYLHYDVRGACPRVPPRNTP